MLMFQIKTIHLLTVITKSQYTIIKSEANKLFRETCRDIKMTAST